MLVCERMAHKRPTLSFGVSAADGAYTAAWRALEQLASLSPDFVVIDCGRAGAVDAVTRAFVERVLSDIAVTPVVRLSNLPFDAHDLLGPLIAAGVRNFVFAGPCRPGAIDPRRHRGSLCIGGALADLHPQTLARAADAGLDFALVSDEGDPSGTEATLPIAHVLVPHAHGEAEDDPQDRFWSGVSRAARRGRGLLYPPRSDPFELPRSTLSGLHIETGNHALAGRALFELLRIPPPYNR